MTRTGSISARTPTEPGSPRSTVPRFILALLLCLTASQAGPVSRSPVEQGKTNVARDVPASIVARLEKQFSASRQKRVIRFYRQHAPNFLLELDSKAHVSPAAADAYFEQLQVRHRLLAGLKKSNPDKYGEEMRALGQRDECMALSRSVRALRRRALAQAADVPVEQLEDLRLRAEKRLYELLGDIFTETQQRQLIEINRLEAEIRELRRLVRQREANRETILQSQFEELVRE